MPLVENRVTAQEMLKGEEKKFKREKNPSGSKKEDSIPEKS